MKVVQKVHKAIASTRNEKKKCSYKPKDDRRYETAKKENRGKWINLENF